MTVASSPTQVVRLYLGGAVLKAQLPGDTELIRAWLDDPSVPPLELRRRQRNCSAVTRHAVRRPIASAAHFPQCRTSADLAVAPEVDAVTSCIGVTPLASPGGVREHESCTHAARPWRTPRRQRDCTDARIESMPGRRVLLRLLACGRAPGGRLPSSGMDGHWRQPTESGTRADALEARVVAVADDACASHVVGRQGGLQKHDRVAVDGEQPSRSMLIECRTTGATT
jgi:hypothetical protein